jgi:hypothetical protein
MNGNKDDDEKTRLAQERRAQALLQQAQASSQHESQPPATIDINADTVLIQGQTENREGHFFLGVAVALCPSDWNRPESIPVSIPRCSNSCCRNRLQPSNQGTCARCTRALCSVLSSFSCKGGRARATQMLWTTSDASAITRFVQTAFCRFHNL